MIYKAVKIAGNYLSYGQLSLEREGCRVLLKCEVEDTDARVVVAVVI